MLKGHKQDLTRNGKDECRAACVKDNPNHKYYGREYTKECFCGSGSLTVNGGKRANSDCNMACSDGSGDKCGGIDRISVYTV